MFIKTFKQLSKNDADIAGGKGASLGEMTNAGIPVPPGFVIVADAYDFFLKNAPKSMVMDVELDIESQLHNVNFDDVNSIDNVSNAIRDIIHDTKTPDEMAEEIKKEFKKLNAELVAVRSSATAEDSSIASWAGELETYLNTREDNLLENVKQCWSSLFTPRAIFYRNEKDLIDAKVSVAVVIQKMIQSEISGICFTVHPVTKDHDQMIIEAGYGLGEAIVSGSVTPDSYIVDKKDFSIEDINIAEQREQIVLSKEGIETVEVPKDEQEKQKLTGEQVVELAKICKTIEDHYGFPCDIEWAYQGGKFYITQSRPITTL